MDRVQPRRCCSCARHMRKGIVCSHCGRWSCLNCRSISFTINGQDPTCRHCAVIDLTVSQDGLSEGSLDGEKADGEEDIEAADTLRGRHDGDDIEGTEKDRGPVDVDGAQSSGSGLNVDLKERDRRGPHGAHFVDARTEPSGPGLPQRRRRWKKGCLVKEEKGANTSRRDAEDPCVAL
eukprot:6479258-Amphidinium_carterae.1